MAAVVLFATQVKEELDFAHRKLREAEQKQHELEEELMEKATELAALKRKSHEHGAPEEKK